MFLSKKYWGPILWKTLYIIAYTYSVESINEINIFYETILKLLPCEECRIHSLEWIKNNPIDTTNKDTLLIWVNNLENSINKKLGLNLVTLDKRLSEMEEKIDTKRTLFVSNSPKKNMTFGVRKKGKVVNWAKAKCSSCE